VEAAEKFWTFLFDHERSPCRLALTGKEEFLRDENGRMVGIYWPETEGIPCNVFTSMLILSRVPTEFPSVLRAFDEYVKAGMDEFDAFYLSQYVGKNFKGQWLLFQGTSIHRVFNTCTDICYKALKDAQPIRDKGAYTVDVNATYGTMFDMYTSDRTSFLDELKKKLEYSEEDFKYDGHFPKAYQEYLDLIANGDEDPERAAEQEDDFGDRWWNEPVTYHTKFNYKDIDWSLAKERAKEAQGDDYDEEEWRS
jgi:hypothetical protein